MKFADLHVHTTASDGRYTPSEAVLKAKELGLAAIGISDHDTMAGITEAVLAGDHAGVEVVPGVEINTDYDGREVHVLGYYVRQEDASFLDLLRNLAGTRHSRLDVMLLRLEQLGFAIDRRSVMEIAGEAAPGRPHVALAMQRAGIVSSTKEAFEKYLGIGRPAYVERYKITPCEAVKAIVRAGGVPCLAHPALIGRPEIVGELVECGLLGIEVMHPDHDKEATRWAQSEARRYGLIATGGSDCHGPGYGHSGAMGEVLVPYEVIPALRRAANLGTSTSRK